jgi:TonB family protein
MLDQLEQQEVEEQHLQARVAAPPTYPAEDDQRQRRRMVIALILLLVALGLVLVKDRDFWFPSADATASDAEAIDDSSTVATVEAANPATENPSSLARAIPSPKKRDRVPVSRPAETTTVATPPSAPSARAVLPPMRVMVDSGGRTQSVKPGAPSVRVVMDQGAVVQQTAEPPTEMASVGNAPLTNAGERIQMSTDARQVLAHPVRPEYPLLARQMKVEGIVQLSAFVGKDGGIQNLSVLAGPTILADAAREAVKQWRFRPHLKDGQPVETQIPITVNFTIRTN